MEINEILMVVRYNIKMFSQRYMYAICVLIFSCQFKEDASQHLKNVCCIKMVRFSHDEIYHMPLLISKNCQVGNCQPQAMGRIYLKPSTVFLDLDGTTFTRILELLEEVDFDTRKPAIGAFSGVAFYFYSDGYMEEARYVTDSKRFNEFYSQFLRISKDSLDNHELDLLNNHLEKKNFYFEYKDE